MIALEWLRLASHFLRAFLLLTLRLTEVQLNVILMRNRFGRLLSGPETGKAVSNIFSEPSSPG